MRRATTVLFMLLLLSPAFASAQTLKGVWRGTAQVTISQSGETTVQQLSGYRILMFTDAFFSWAFEPEEPRTISDINSDAQVATAARAYNQSAGTYMRDGMNVVYDRRTAVNPNARAAANQPLVRQIRVLTATNLVTQATNADGVTTLLVYERVE